eukprot:GHVT01077181.1.p1 GENE.GHVT01077181.1~~GHVT01077181.1.p1  ORF type:complete len:105 (+),score=6.62 GHVT01077181.1:283-597(+)
MPEDLDVSSAAPPQRNKGKGTATVLLDDRKDEIVRTLEIELEGVCRPPFLLFDKPDMKAVLPSLVTDSSAKKELKEFISSLTSSKIKLRAAYYKLFINRVFVFL